eukprot:gene23931-9499_t
MAASIRAKVRAHADVEAGKRTFLQQAGCTFLAATIASTSVLPALAAVPYNSIANEGKVLCEAECVASLDSIETITTASGLQYKDIIVGKGDAPPIGFQVVANYVAMTPQGRAFESSLEKGKVGSGQVIPGLDEGLTTMRTGGLRRLYIPGDLAFPRGLRAAAGRPSVPPSSPVIFDVQLLYIPGMEVEELDEE